MFRTSVFCFQAEDGIRVAQESRGLGDVYKRQILPLRVNFLPLPLTETCIFIKLIIFFQ